MESLKRKIQTGERYLSFSLMEEEYCIEILRVREIMGMIDITHVPQTPGFIRGVINLRGNILPVLDLRLKFEMEYREYTDRTCIIVVELPGREVSTLMGIVVDSIHEVVNIQKEKITQVPYINAKIKSDYILGMAETEDSIKIVLDIGRVLSDEDYTLVGSMQKTENA